MNNNTITPQDYQKLRDNLPKDRQESLYRLDEVEAYELHDKLEDEKAKISKANKQIESSQGIIDEQNKVKQKSQEIIADITGSPVSPKEANETPKIKGRMLKINSDSWTTIEEKNGVRAKTNGKGVWEYLEDAPNGINIKGEQIFTQDVAIREAKNNNMRVPEHYELLQIIQSINPDIDPTKGWQYDNTKPSIKETLGVKLAGYRNPDGYFGIQGGYGYLWSATEGYYVTFNVTLVYPKAKDDPSCALSVFVVEN